MCVYVCICVLHVCMHASASPCARLSHVCASDVRGVCPSPIKFLSFVCAGTPPYASSTNSSLSLSPLNSPAKYLHADADVIPDQKHSQLQTIPDQSRPTESESLAEEPPEELMSDTPTKDATAAVDRLVIMVCGPSFSTPPLRL